MRSRFPVLAGFGALAASVVLIGVVGVAPASAAATPPWEPTDLESGTVSFYDASGSQITSGPLNTAPFATYLVGSATIRAGDTQAITIMSQPNPNANPDLWNNDFIGGGHPYPLTSGPANIVALSQTHPVVTGVATDITVEDFVQEFPNTDPSGIGCAYSIGNPAGCTNTNYQNLYQVKLFTANPAGTQTQNYDSADILVNEAAHTWTQVYPTPGSGPVTTTTSLSANPTTAAQGDQVMLTATVTGSGAAGSVEFFNGTTSLGKADVSGGTASLTTTALPVGSDSLTATFTPTDSTAFTSSTSPPVSVTITGNTPPPNSGSETINVDVPQATEGTLTLTVDQTPVQMSTPTSNGSALDSKGTLSPVTVTDGRNLSKPGWNVSGQVSDFHSGSNTIDGNSLGWTPKIATPNAANDVTAGPQVNAGANPGLKQGSGLASAGAGKGLGQTTLGGDLDLQIPVDTPAGTYSATLTITAI